MTKTNPTQLTEAQRALFWEQGYLIVENSVDAELLAALRGDFATWVTESRNHNAPYGDTLDGRPRFDLEPGHTADRPGLRRVNAPVEVSRAYFSAMADSRMTDCVAELVGPNVKLHHSKINSKQPTGATEVKWHQDFPFTPHSNDDLVTALLMVDDVTLENGPLEIVPGSHKGEIHGLWHDDSSGTSVFTGAVTEAVAEDCRAKAVVCTGKAGSLCLMHTRLLHGSAPNRSDRPRTLFITVYSAEDAVPLSANPMPTKYEGLVVRGEGTNRVRSIAFEMPLPQKPTTASFFDQQAEHQRVA